MTISLAVTTIYKHQMRPFIYSDLKEECAFEGVRLRKNLKGALELAKVTYAPSFMAAPDIFHTICPLKESRITEECEENGVKAVVSAFFASHDAACSFLEEEKKGELSLTKAGLKTLKRSDLIFVPSEEAKAYLSSFNLPGKITVITPGVNLARFDVVDPLEADIFRSYARLQKGQKYVLSGGNYEDIEEFERLSEIAKKHRDIRFFYFGISRKGPFSPRARKHLSKIYGENISFCSLVEDDVFRSAMSGASAFFAFGNRPSQLSVLEAYSARVPVYEWKNKRFGNLSINGKTGWVYDDITKIDECFSLWCQSEGDPTIIEAYEYAKHHSLRELGKELQESYKDILQD